MNKYLKIVLYVLGIIFAFVLIDTAQALILDNSPILSVKYVDEQEKWYINKGILVNTYNIEGPRKTLFKWEKFAIAEPYPNIDVSKTQFEIVDETGGCSEALEGFYSDSKYLYFFPCIQSHTVFVKFNTGLKCTAVEALGNNLVTIDELIAKGLLCYKEERKKTSTLKCEYADVTTLFYFDGVLYGKSYSQIDYADGTECIGTITTLIGKKYVPTADGETNSEELVGAKLYSKTENSIVALCGNTYELFEKI